jgi:Tfp pilus assembly protein PilF
MTLSALQPSTQSTIAMLVALVLVACGGKQGGAKNPERQSLAEYDIAVDLFHKGRPREALDHALKAVELDEENAKAAYFASLVYASFCDTVQGFASPDCRLEDAEKHARQAIKIDGSLRDAKNLLGQILIHEKKYDEAIAFLEPLTKDPAYVDSYKAWGNLGWAQVLKGQLDAGIASLKNSVTEPRFCVGHYRLGVAYEKQGNLPQAETSFTTAVQVEHPNCQNLQDAWEARGRIRQRLGKSVEARADFEKCREISMESRAGKSCVQALGTLPK